MLGGRLTLVVTFTTADSLAPTRHSSNHFIHLLCNFTVIRPTIAAIQLISTEHIDGIHFQPMLVPLRIIRSPDTPPVVGKLQFECSTFGVYTELRLVLGFNPVRIRILQVTKDKLRLWLERLPTYDRWHWWSFDRNAPFVFRADGGSCG